MEVINGEQHLMGFFVVEEETEHLVLTPQMVEHNGAASCHGLSAAKAMAIGAPRSYFEVLGDSVLVYVSVEKEEAIGILTRLD